MNFSFYFALWRIERNVFGVCWDGFWFDFFFFLKFCESRVLILHQKKLQKIIKFNNGKHQ
jgi:hypothetical protein